ENLRVYLTHFSGQHATRLSVDADVPGDVAHAVKSVRESLGAGNEGQPVDAHGSPAVGERVADELLQLRLTGPVPGFLPFYGSRKVDEVSWARLEGRLFSPDAPAYVEREQAEWKAWLERIGASVGRR